MEAFWEEESSYCIKRVIRDMIVMIDVLCTLCVLSD